MFRRTLAVTCTVFLLAMAFTPTALASRSDVDRCHDQRATSELDRHEAGTDGQHHVVPRCPGPHDRDGDGVPDATDNCPTIANPDQADNYGSAKGDACEDTDRDGILDVNEPDICVSRDNVAILGRGTAVCFTAASTGAKPNIAVADGDQASASAFDGNNNTATATGNHAVAESSEGDDNHAIASATATGNHAVASAGYGSHNTAIATGNEASASATNGDHNRAIATGNHAIAAAFSGDDNHVIAMATTTGTQTIAIAGNGSKNNATAIGNFAVASALNGDHNRAKANGYQAIAFAGNGDHNTARAIGDNATASATAALGCTYIAPPNGYCS